MNRYRSNQLKMTTSTYRGGIAVFGANSPAAGIGNHTDGVSGLLM